MKNFPSWRGPRLWDKNLGATKMNDCGYQFPSSRPAFFRAAPPSLRARRCACLALLVIGISLAAYFLFRRADGVSFLVYGDGGAPSDPMGRVAQQVGYQPGSPVIAPKEQEFPLPPPPQSKPGGVQCSVTQGSRPPQPEIPPALDGNVYVPRADWGVLTQTSGKIPNSLTAKESNAGSPFESSSFKPSAATMNFYNAFNPASINSLMPASWRGSADQSPCVEEADYNSGPTTKKYDEFSRYSVSPMSAQHAESLRGTIRLSELSSTRNAKTLGVQSLLRNVVTPISPMPIGSSNYSWGDSDARLSMIAAATGSYPDEIGC
jgi:hypothetical protein